MFDEYIALLKAYNETTNIYSKKAFDKLPFHIADSVRLAEIITNTSLTVFDIGSGSGLPAVPIAIHNPKNIVYAIESKSRKTRFLSEVKSSLGLDNLHVVTKNIFEFVQETRVKADVVTAKAFGSYEKVLKIVGKMKVSPKRIYIPVSLRQVEALGADSDIGVLRFEEEGFYYLTPQSA